MEKTINNSATKKSVRVNANGAAAAFSKANPQMYCKSEVVLDSQFINEVVGGLVTTIFDAIEAGVKMSQQNRKVNDDRALWLHQHGLTAAQVADILYVPECQQQEQVQEMVKAEVATPEVNAEQDLKAENVQQPTGQYKRRYRGGRKHRNATQANNESSSIIPSTPNAAMTQQKSNQVPPTVKRTVQSTVKRPARSPMENLKNIVMRDPSLGQELLAVLRKHDVSINQIFEE